MLKCFVISLATTLFFLCAIGEVNLNQCVEEEVDLLEVFVAQRWLK